MTFNMKSCEQFDFQLQVFILSCFFYNRTFMIYKYIRKKFIQLPLAEKFRNDCIGEIDRLITKEQNREEPLPKSDIIIKICQNLIKVSEGLSDGNEIADGFKVLQFIKAMTMQIYENNRIEVYLIKIRTYLLTIKWSKIKSLPLGKLVSKICLFLEQMKSTPIYEVVLSDYYSHIERLYLEVIREKIKSNELVNALKLIGVCFEAFKAQINLICNIFGAEEKKMHRLIEKKLDLLSLLFKYEHGAKFMTNEMDADQITSQILPKYERVTFKIPIIHFPNQNLLIDCESLWNNSKLRKHHSNSRSTKKLSLIESMSSLHMNSFKKSKHRQSLKETMEYLNDFFRKRSNSAIELNFQPLVKLNLESNLRHLPEVKKSYFQKEKFQNLKEGFAREEEKDLNKRLFKDVKNISKQKRPKSGHKLIEPKKFKLVLEMDRQAREKILQYDPFKGMNEQELNLLAPKNQSITNQLIFYPQN